MAPRHVTDFVQQLTPMAVEIGDRYGIDPALIITQAAIESGWGKDVSGNNYFGVKSHGKPGGQTITTHEEIDGKRVKVQDNFRVYDSLAGSMEDYARFLRENPRYGDVFKSRDLDKQIAAIAGSGYATDSKYPGLLRDVSRMVKREMGPMPPAQIPNTVASQLDTTPQTRNVPLPQPRPQQRQSLMDMITPRLTAQGDDIYSFQPPITLTSVTRGLGSLTPDAVQETPPSQVPQWAMLPNTEPRNVPLPRPRPAMGSDPGGGTGTTIASIPTAPQPRQSLPRLDVSRPQSYVERNPPNIVSTSMDRVNAARDPKLQSALDSRASWSPPPRPTQENVVAESMLRTAAARDPELQAALLATNRPTGPALSRDSVARSAQGSALAAALSGPSIPGPNAPPKAQDRLPAGVLPVNPSSQPMPGVVNANPIMVGGPSPKPSNAVSGFPVSAALRPQPILAQAPRPITRITVQGAGSYRDPVPTREQQIAAILEKSRGPAAFGGGGTINGAVQPVGTLF